MGREIAGVRVRSPRDECVSSRVFVAGLVLLCFPVGSVHVRACAQDRVTRLGSFALALGEFVVTSKFVVVTCRLPQVDYEAARVPPLHVFCPLPLSDVRGRHFFAHFHLLWFEEVGGELVRLPMKVAAMFRPLRLSGIRACTMGAAVWCCPMPSC